MWPMWEGIYNKKRIGTTHMYAQKKKTGGVKCDQCEKVFSTLKQVWDHKITSHIRKTS